ncbi:MAG: DUF2157 domain-containing protein [Planctomycetaceae bacterium]|nr:DUF2157 domain-containing protein [Planctomycetaceae bacterium]
MIRSMFQKRLEGLLHTALERKIIGSETADALRALATEQGKEGGALTLASVLGWLGGGAVVLGIMLLVASNWSGIPDLVKIGGFLLLFGGAHAVGFTISRLGLPYERTAAAFHFIGGGLFLGGVGLIAQIYHLHGRPPNGVLLWLVSLVPLVILLRSASLSLLSVFAFVLWAHLEAAQSGSPFHIYDSFALHLVLQLGIGVALIGFSSAVKDWDAGVAAVLRGCGVLLLFYIIYTLGFYRYFAGHSGWSGRSEHERSLMVWILLGLGGVGLGVGARKMAPESSWLRLRLLVLLGATLLVGAGIAAVETGLVGQGERVEQNDFGWTHRYSVAGWTLTVFAWALWFLIGLWCIAWGAKADRKGFVNLGVLAVGAGIITRFFDLVGSLAETGTLFLVGGVVLLGTAFGMEKWRRRIVKRMQTGKAAA